MPTNMVIHEGRALTPNESLPQWPLFPSAYSFRGWYQNNFTGSVYSIVQHSSLFSVQKEVVLYSQGAGFCYVRKSLLQAMNNERELGIKNFPICSSMALPVPPAQYLRQCDAKSKFFSTFSFSYIRFFYVYMEKMQLLFSLYFLLLYMSTLTQPEKAEGYLFF